MKRKVIKSSMCRKAWAAVEDKKEWNGWRPWVLQWDIHRPAMALLWHSFKEDVTGLFLPYIWTWELTQSSSWFSPEILTIGTDPKWGSPRSSTKFLTQFSIQQFGCWMSTEIYYRNYPSNSFQNCSPEPTCEAQHGLMVSCMKYIF